MALGWPDAEALGAHLTAMGWADLPAPELLEGVLAAEIASWELETGWQPFLAEATTSSETAELKGCDALRLRSGFATVTGVTVNGTPVELGTDVQLERFGEGGPVSWLRFRFGVFGPVVTTGRKGFALEIPADAYQALLDRVTVRLAAGRRTASGEPVEIRQGALSLRFGEATSAQELSARADATVRRYRRGVV